MQGVSIGVSPQEPKDNLLCGLNPRVIAGF
jgi:hypothetical protein